MLNNLFSGIFDTGTQTVISPGTFLLCIGAALVVGLMIAGMYSFKNRSSSNFVITLALLPAVVSVIIMLVNGNIGAGVAVAGAFSLVRFRSAPGTAREIASLFLAMGAGLIVGMGYLAYAFVFSIIVGAVGLLYSAIGFGENKIAETFRQIKITIPEDLNYTEVFDEIMEEYTTECKLEQVKTTNMGSLYKLQYSVQLRAPEKEKEFLDALRCRNGNLEIVSSRNLPKQAEL